jgi:hypothetical protein
MQVDVIQIDSARISRVVILNVNSVGFCLPCCHIFQWNSNLKKFRMSKERGRGRGRGGEEERGGEEREIPMPSYLWE